MCFARECVNVHVCACVLKASVCMCFARECVHVHVCACVLHVSAGMGLCVHVWEGGGSMVRKTCVGWGGGGGGKATWKQAAREAYGRASRASRATNTYLLELFLKQAGIHLMEEEGSKTSAAAALAAAA